jgi:hypothetical protein
MTLLVTHLRNDCICKLCDQRGDSIRNGRGGGGGGENLGGLLLQQVYQVVHLLEHDGKNLGERVSMVWNNTCCFGGAADTIALHRKNILRQKGKYLRKSYLGLAQVSPGSLQKVHGLVAAAAKSRESIDITHRKERYKTRGGTQSYNTALPLQQAKVLVKRSLPRSSISRGHSVIQHGRANEAGGVLVDIEGRAIYVRDTTPGGRRTSSTRVKADMLWGQKDIGQREALWYRADHRKQNGKANALGAESYQVRPNSSGTIAESP